MNHSRHHEAELAARAGSTCTRDAVSDAQSDPLAGIAPSQSTRAHSGQRRRIRATMTVGAAASVFAVASCGGSPFDNCEARRTCQSADGGHPSATAGALGYQGDGGEPERFANGGASGEGAASDGGVPSELGTSGAGGVSNDDTGSPSGSGGEAGVVLGCDRRRSPREETCLLTDEFAVFVAPSGSNEENDGTRSAPVRTLAHAIELAKDSERIVVACAGQYHEQLVLKHGVRLYGGFACPAEVPSGADWQPLANAKSQVVYSQFSANGIPLDIQNVADPVVIEDFELRARDAEEFEASSIAARVVASKNVTFSRVLLRAGKGKHGASPFGMWDIAEPQPIGNDGTESAGGTALTCYCPGGSVTQGGAGGDPGEDGGDGLPDLNVWTGSGGKAPGGPRDGADGFDAPKGLDAAAPTTLGKIVGDMWIASDGLPGEHGQPGEGGGGGAGSAESGETAGGGSGGCGGCGGKGGAAGEGGGASIALLSLESRVSLIDSQLIASDAGNGGEGGPSQAGRPGSAGGEGFPGMRVFGGRGGRGGHGGDSGYGSGGAGGISVGVLYRGAEPDRVGTNIIVGLPGAAGNAYAPNSDRVDGIATEVMAVP